MEDIIGQVLAVIIFGGLAIMAVYITSARSRGHEARQKAADRRGWKYEKFTKTVNIVAGEASDSPNHAVLYRMQGKLSDAMPWQIETRCSYTRRGGTVGEKVTFWQTRSTANPSLYIHITPKASLGVTVIGGDQEAELKNISLEKGRYSLGQELRHFGNAPSVDILEAVHQLDIGPAGWQEKFNLFSDDKDAARRLLDSKLQSALFGWAVQYKQTSRCPMVTFCPQGVQITLGWTVEKVDTLDQLVALGQLAVRASREMG